MNPGLVVKLRPTGPWRVGPDSGARNRVDSIYHSDALYGAVTSAMLKMGLLEEWLDATARNVQAPAVTFSSCFPFLDAIGFVVPPRSIWPPQGGSPLVATKVRWKSARFIPLGLVSALLAGQVLDEEHWTVDGLSECLLPVGRPGPFRAALRGNAAVDRLSGATERHSTACIDFRQGAGLWAVVSFAGEAERERWSGRVRSAIRLLADSGFGGERSRGWGHAQAPEFIDGILPDMILPPTAPVDVAPAPAPEQSPEAAPAAGAESASVESRAAESNPAEIPVPVETAPTPYWLLSLLAPGAADTIDWKRGNYTVIARGGRVDSPAGSGALKKQLSMVAEGSVLYAGEPIRGSAVNVAPDGFAHPVFRVGFAVSIPLSGQGIS
ncbi:MAG TPA: hypothetical protein VG672_24140 [Bryobacteraceae bacterium]|nr:hypothetical protein [Bryobacteraceae bacterium]